MRSPLAFLRRNRFVRSERGGALAELAILVPFLVVMLAAVTELGRLFQTYTALSKSTRAAARYMSNNAYTDANIQNAQHIAVCGQTNCTGVDPVVPGLADTNVSVEPDEDFKNGGGAGNPKTITISIHDYAFQPIFNLGALIGNTNFMALPASGTTTMYYMWVDPVAHN